MFGIEKFRNKSATVPPLWLRYMTAEGAHGWRRSSKTSVNKLLICGLDTAVQDYPSWATPCLTSGVDMIGHEPSVRSPHSAALPPMHTMMSGT